MESANGTVKVECVYAEHLLMFVNYANHVHSLR